MSRPLLSLLTFLFLSIICNAFSPENPTDRKVLVLLDDLSVKSSHSLYFQSLQSRGYDLDFKLADDPRVALQRYGQYLYDALILFSPTIESLGGSLNAAAILDFVDSGHDLILAADASASDLIREIATECGVDFDEDQAAMVIDHTSFAVSDTEGDHTLIAGDNFIQSDVILGKEKIKAPVLFKGIGHSVNPANSLVLKVLSASPAAYSANPKSKLSTPPTLTGSAIGLVSVVQARNNARILISGSLSMFSNRFFRSGVQKAGSTINHGRSGNEQFVTEISKWVFHERGHLKEYSLEIYEWSGTSWEPYVADDVQVQFYMMSPYVLKTMSTDQKGIYYTSFKVPDVYGVFQFKVEYKKLGVTSLSLAKQIPVRPFRHNEYERFITAAFPYYGASFSMEIEYPENLLQ
ncbi:Dolichyl-diphosphooligosaccharide--protein glycosyltransferase 48 kDa subunit [Capsicum annuum]|nr:Dolichyl-diphosphooligosaccharide--protein glycosyltransferase 48 kDa subunit [Capsicum annuum]